MKLAPIRIRQSSVTEVNNVVRSSRLRRGVAPVLGGHIVRRNRTVDADCNNRSLGFRRWLTDVEQLSGIVGIVAVGGAQFGSTLASLLTFSVLINLSLAVMNLLPLPPLDGGRILFCVLEKIYRPVVKVEAPLTVAGWTMVLALMVYVTVQDVGRILA